MGPGRAREPLARALVLPLVTVAATVALRLALTPVLGDRMPFLLFTIPVIVSAWSAGAASGLLALVLSVIAGALFARDGVPGMLDRIDAAQTGIFVVVGGVLLTLTEAARGSRERLADAERRARHVLDASHEGVWLVDTGGRITYANPALAEMLGCERAEVARLHHEQLVRLGRSRRAGERFDATLRRADGSDLVGQVTLAEVVKRDRDGAAVLGMISDVTSLRRAERERDRLHDAERRARADAEAANRAKDEFLAIVSHELRTPLNAVLGWASLLGRDLSPEKRQKAVSAIQRSARAQAQLIEDLLDTSRIQAGKLTLDRRLVPIAPCVRAALEVVAAEASAKGVVLTSSLPEGEPGGTVLGDPHRIQQIVTNLLTNAVKFTSAGKQVHLALREVGDSVELEVRDEGDGIAPELLPHVFDRFRQAEGGSKRHGGLGLGLAIVRHLVAEHGGTVEARSDGPGRGATFVVRLPRAPIAVPDEERGEATPDPRALRGLKVLLVDDDTDGREALGEALARAGATVRMAGSVEDAWREIAQRAWVPDVLVSDLAMPHDDGVDLMRRVRALPRDAGGGVPALAVSAHARSADRTLATAAGFDRHLAKPIDPDELVRAVGDLWRARS